ncbi:MAG: SseB family protein [Clostridia bacterium]|nr:SseB family protein [Clostridia bacterium]
MAWFGKKKKEQAEKPEKTEQSSSTLDIIKETMAEASQEREARMQEAAASATEGGDMPTADEIKRAQEVIARAQAAQAQAQPQVRPNAGVNAPINMASLKAVINNFVQNKSQENMQKIVNCLQNPKTLVCVPAQIITSKENQEKMKQGGEVKLEGPVKINPLILTDNTGKKVFPMFSGEELIPDDLKKKTPKVNMPFGQCLNIMRGMKDVDTVVLDPYTANIRIGVNVETK